MISETQKLISGNFLNTLRFQKSVAENCRKLSSLFAKIYRVCRRQKMGELSVDDVHSFQVFLNRYKDLHGHNLGPKTQNFHLIALRAF